MKDVFANAAVITLFVFTACLIATGIVNLAQNRITNAMICLGIGMLLLFHLFELFMEDK